MLLCNFRFCGTSVLLRSRRSRWRCGFFVSTVLFRSARVLSTHCRPMYFTRSNRTTSETQSNLTESYSVVHTKAQNSVNTFEFCRIIAHAYRMFQGSITVRSETQIILGTFTSQDTPFFHLWTKNGVDRIPNLHDIKVKESWAATQEDTSKSKEPEDDGNLCGGGGGGIRDRAPRPPSYASPSPIKHKTAAWTHWRQIITISSSHLKRATVYR